MNRSHIVSAGLAMLAAIAGCHRSRPAISAAAPVSNRPDTFHANSDSLDRQREERDRAARQRADRERTRLDAMRRDVEMPIYFAFDRSTLSDEARARLEAKIPILAGGGPTLRIVIEGHADEAGSDEYNLALGQRRAAEAKRYLVAREIAPARIDIVSFGEERPACTREGDACPALNRRDEFRIVTGTISASER